jgi:hypothetical protein
MELEAHYTEILWRQRQCEYRGCLTVSPKKNRIIRDEDSRHMHGAVTNQNPLGGDLAELPVPLIWVLSAPRCFRWPLAEKWAI